MMFPTLIKLSGGVGYGSLSTPGKRDLLLILGGLSIFFFIYYFFRFKDYDKYL